MQKPRISPNNRIVAQQRRASKEITQEIEKEIDQLHVFNAMERSKEFLFFIAFYIVGASIVFLSNEILMLMLVGILFMGVALNSLGIFIHEGLHGLLAKNRYINHLLTFLVGLPILISATAYQTTHTDHHFELGRKLDYGTYRQHLRNRGLVWLAYLLQLFLGSIIYVVFIPILALKSGSNRSRFFIAIEYVVIISSLIILFTYAPLNSILLYWIYPLIVLAPLSQLRGLSSHALGDVEDIYLSSRTIKCSKFMSLLFLNENYHLEHHLFPRIPSYNLPKTHLLIWKRLPKALYSKSYPDFLLTFFKALLKKELRPQGVVKPSKTI